MPFCIQGPGPEVCSRDTCHNQMGQPTLEATRVIPGACGAQMVAHAQVHPDHDASAWGAAASSPGHPLRRYPCMLPGGVVLDGRPHAILAGSHGHSSVRWSLLPGESSGQHPHPRHQRVVAPLYAIRMEIRGQTRLPVAQRARPIRRGAPGRMGSPEAMGLNDLE